MSSKKVLVLPGDGDGPVLVAAAEDVLEAATSGVDLIHGEIGAAAYGHTSQALPAETADLAAAADAVLSGPVGNPLSMGNLRNPLATLRKQLNLLAEVREFYPLCSYLGNRDVDLVFVSFCSDTALSVTEVDSLDGISTDHFTGVDASGELFDLALAIGEMRRRKRVTCLSGTGLFPASEKLFVDLFHRHFAATEFLMDDANSAQAACRLAADPSSLELVVSGLICAPAFAGQAAGMIGGDGLMPVGYVGRRGGLFMPTMPTVADRSIPNPTSAILAGALMLLNLGMDSAYEDIKKAVREMYRVGRVTPDRGGNLSTAAFAHGVADLVRSYQ